MGLAMARVPAGVAAAGVALAAGVRVLRRRYVIITVRGASMEPTLRDGDRVVVRRRPLSHVRSGDVVVFASAPDPDLPGLPPEVAATVEQGSAEWLIKRSVAIPGDAVPRATVPALADADHDVVPADVFAVVGDNATYSYDSRVYGYVTADRLLGVALRNLGGSL
jgi:signal peptidase I